MRSDLRLAFRRLAKEPALAVSAVLILALGIGACTAMFSVIRAVLLKTMGIDAPARLVMMWPEVGDNAGEFSYNAYRQLARDATLFESVALMGSANWPVPVDIQFPDGRRARATQSAVSSTFFDVLGARPALGRTFVPEDDRAGGAPVIVVSDRFWRAALGADPQAVERSLTIGTVAWRVIGVMPPEFFFPTGADLWSPAATLLAIIWADRPPAAIEQLFEGVGAFHVVGRLKPGVSITQAHADATRLWRAHATARGLDPATVDVAIRPFLDHVFGNARRALWLLMGAVVLLLLTTCANVAGLLIARAALRSREMSVRVALGATRWQVLRQHLLEAGLLSILAGALGVAAAVMSIRGLIALSPTAIVRLSGTQVDLVVLAVAVLITTMVTLLVGLVSSLRVLRASASNRLQGLSDRHPSSSIRGGTRRSLVVAQVAVTMALLVAGALAAQSFRRLADLDLGFDPSNVLTFDLDRLDQGRYPTHAARHRVIDALLADIERLPGVRSAAAVLLRPFGAGVIGWDTGLLLEGQPDTPTTWMTNPIVNWEAVTPRYFETMGIRLLRGRDFATTDRAGTPMVVIVSELLAERAWPGQDPLGKRLIDGFVGGGMGARPQRWQTVVGVVESAQYRTLDQPRPDLYVPLAQAGDSDAAHAVIRTTGDPRSMPPQIGALLSHVDPQLANTGFTTMDEVVAQVQAPWRFNMQLFSAFGFASIGITALGIVGLVVSTVNWRRREIGVRLALGGQPQQVVSMILREGFGLVGVGVAIGLFVSLLASRLLSGLLFGISASDPATFASMGLAVAALGAIACYLPARRAAAVDPCIVFRDE